MKSIEIDPSLDADPELSRSVRRANELLENELGPSKDVVSARWTLTRDGNGRRLILLDLSDWTGHVSSPFTPDELKSDWHVQGRLIRVWGDLLQVRTRKLRDEILSANSTAEGV